MSLYDGIEVETAPISTINISQAMEVDQKNEKPPVPPPPKQAVTTGNSINTTSNTSSNSKWTRVNTSSCIMVNGCQGGLASSLKFMAPQLQRRKAPSKPGQVNTMNCVEDHVLLLIVAEDKSPAIDCCTGRKVIHHYTSRLCIVLLARL